MCRLRLCAVLLVLFQAAHADAAVSERDWKMPGDGLLTYDDVNQREWLDLSETILSSQFPGADREAKFQHVHGQTAPGGFFEGFRVAKSADVIALAESAGIDTDTLNHSTNQLPTLALQDLLGTTFTIRDHIFSIGLLDETQNQTQSSRLGAIFRISIVFEAGLILEDPIRFFQLDPSSGVMLYRVVPEPSTATFVLPVLFAIGALSPRNLRGRQSRRIDWPSAAIHHRRSFDGFPLRGEPILLG